MLASENTARTNRYPGQRYRELVLELGNPAYERTDAPATVAQKELLGRLSPADIRVTALAGEPIRQILTIAPGDGSSIGRIKVMTDTGWFAARPSGTEDVYKVYAESFGGEASLRSIQREAEELVAETLGRMRV